nr:hypothetical protein [uncultured Sphingomonas sp.]
MRSRYTFDIVAFTAASSSKHDVGTRQKPLTGDATGREPDIGTGSNDLDAPFCTLISRAVLRPPAAWAYRMIKRRWHRRATEFFREGFGDILGRGNRLRIKALAHIPAFKPDKLIFDALKKHWH